MPFILAGLRLGVGHAPIGVVVGELVAAQAGVGLMMARAGVTFQTAKVFGGLMIVAGTGIVLAGIVHVSRPLPGLETSKQHLAARARWASFEGSPYLWN